MEKKSILLIAFYNKKALGVRYLEKSLVRAGHKVFILFLKHFNSKRPDPVNSKELLLIKDLVKKLEPGLIGLSVMSSLYMESVITVNSFLRKHFDIPIVWGGVYASMFPEKSLTYADFVLRGECEEAVVELADAVSEHNSHQGIANLVYKDHSRGGKTVVNDLRPLCSDLDTLGYPLFNSNNKYYIDNGQITYGDPMTGSISYELSASRGCPYMCSYCSSINLKRLYKGCGRYVRFRSVPNIISELEEALTYIRDLRVIHFWDEIFPDDSTWTDDFSSIYKTRIGLPFEIWGHPLRCSDHTISRLVEAGLYKVVMGIQSGSPRIRSDVFHRSESQTDILQAAKTLSRNRVPQVVYDFILRHPFENEEDIKQTFELCTKLEKPFELQLHGLNFFPGTDIITIAESSGTDVKISESGPGVPMREAYKTYWGQKNSDMRINYWYSLIYLSQFRLGLPVAKFLSRASGSWLYQNIAILLSRLFCPAAKLRYFYKKALLLVRASFNRNRTLRESRHVVQYNETQR